MNNFWEELAEEIVGALAIVVGFLLVVGSFYYGVSTVHKILSKPKYAEGDCLELLNEFDEVSARYQVVKVGKQHYRIRYYGFYFTDNTTVYDLDDVSEEKIELIDKYARRVTCPNF